MGAGKGVEVKKIYSALDTKHSRVLALRLQGKTLREAGEAVGVSTERARQIEAKAWVLVRRALHSKVGDLTELNLSARAYNALLLNDIRSIAEFLVLSDRELTKLKQVGEQTLKEIKDAIRDYAKKNLRRKTSLSFHDTHRLG